MSLGSYLPFIALFFSSRLRLVSIVICITILLISLLSYTIVAIEIVVSHEVQSMLSISIMITFCIAFIGVPLFRLLVKYSVLFLCFYSILIQSLCMVLS